MRKFKLFGGLGVAVLACCAAVGLWRFFSAPPDSFAATSRIKSGTAQNQETASQAEVGNEASVQIGPKLRDGFPETIAVASGARRFELECTGLFVRKRSLLIVPIELYSIANYVSHPKADEGPRLLDQLLVDGEAKVYLLRFLKPLSGPQILNAIQEEIDLTFTDVDMEKNGGDIRRFVQKFANGSNKGEVVYMCWLPGNRLYCSYNDPTRLELISTDAAIARAIWRIWCGESAGPERLGLVSRLAAQPR